MIYNLNEIIIVIIIINDIFFVVLTNFSSFPVSFSYCLFVYTRLHLTASLFFLLHEHLWWVPLPQNNQSQYTETGTPVFLPAPALSLSLSLHFGLALASLSNPRVFFSNSKSHSFSLSLSDSLPSMCLHRSSFRYYSLYLFSRSSLHWFLLLLLLIVFLWMLMNLFAFSFMRISIFYFSFFFWEWFLGLVDSDSRKKNWPKVTSSSCFFFFSQFLPLYLSKKRIISLFLEWFWFVFISLFSESMWNFDKWQVHVVKISSICILIFIFFQILKINHLV